MIIKLLTGICCAEGTYIAGDTPDLEDGTAIALIKGGYATPMATVKITQEVIIPAIQDEIKSVTQTRKPTPRIVKGK